MSKGMILNIAALKNISIKVIPASRSNKNTCIRAL
jgi:hypothetical protein